MHLPEFLVSGWEVLDTLGPHVAVLDHHGTIVAVNSPWNRFAAQNGGVPASCGIGTNYLDVCGRDPFDDHARTAHDGIEKVMEGSLSAFTLRAIARS